MILWFLPEETKSHEALAPGLAAAHLQAALLCPRGVGEGVVSILRTLDPVAAVVRMKLTILSFALDKKLVVRKFFPVELILILPN